MNERIDPGAGFGHHHGPGEVEHYATSVDPDQLQCVRLARALEAAQAEIAVSGPLVDEARAAYARMRARAERAEAQVAAVRALCDRWEHYPPGDIARTYAAGRVLAALDGAAPPATLTWDEAATVATSWFQPTPPEPHPFAPTRGPDAFGGKCGRCGGPGGAPWHGAAPPAAPTQVHDEPRSEATRLASCPGQGGRSCLDWLNTTGACPNCGEWLAR